MSVRTAYVNRQVIIDGRSFSQTVEVGHDQLLDSDVELSAAKTGSLTTRTDNNTGTLTMASGHGITTGAKIAVFWEDDTTLGATAGMRTNVTAGTVSGTSVPIDLGDGDNLPPVNVAVTAMVLHEEVFNIEDGVLVPVFLVADIPARGCVIFAAADGTPVLTVQITEAGVSYVWTTESGADNPVSGTDVAKILTAHEDSASARRVYVAVGY